MVDLIEVMSGLYSVYHWVGQGRYPCSYRDRWESDERCRESPTDGNSIHNTNTPLTVAPKRKVRQGTNYKLERKSDREDLVRTIRYIISLEFLDGSRIKTPSRMSLSSFGLHKHLQNGREAKKPVVGMPPRVPIARSDVRFLPLLLSYGLYRFLAYATWSISR